MYIILLSVEWWNDLPLVETATAGDDRHRRNLVNTIMNSLIGQTRHFRNEFRDYGLDLYRFEGGPETLEAYERLVKGVLAYERKINFNLSVPPKPLFMTEEERKAAGGKWETKAWRHAEKGNHLLFHVCCDRATLLQNKEGVYLNTEIIRLYDTFLQEVKEVQKHLPLKVKAAA